MSFYEEVVPLLSKGLSSHRHQLQRAKAHAEEQGYPPERLLDVRLYPDMFSMRQQSQTVTDLVGRCMARLVEKEPTLNADKDESVDAMVARVDATLAVLSELEPGAFDAAATKEFTVEMGGFELPFTGQSYFRSFTLPNFTFHLTTGYNILRHSGVKLGKADFLRSFVAPQP